LGQCPPPQCRSRRTRRPGAFRLNDSMLELFDWCSTRSGRRSPPWSDGVDRCAVSGVRPARSPVSRRCRRPPPSTASARPASFRVQVMALVHDQHDQLAAARTSSRRARSPAAAPDARNSRRFIVTTPSTRQPIADPSSRRRRRYSSERRPPASQIFKKGVVRIHICHLTCDMSIAI
jgi:hypothetical protein